MALRESTNAAGVRSIYDDHMPPTAADMDERAAISRQHLSMVTVRVPQRPDETDIGNDAELRAALGVAIEAKGVAQRASEQADRARDRAQALADQAAVEVREAAEGLAHGGADLARRIAAWAGSDAPEPNLASNADGFAARSRHGNALAVEHDAKMALGALTRSADDQRVRVTTAGLEVNRAVYAVVARDAEEIARRAAALRDEADAMERGATSFRMHFGPQSSLGHKPHTVTGGVGMPGRERPSPAFLTGGKLDPISEAWGAYVRALHTDPNATLVLSTAS